MMSLNPILIYITITEKLLGNQAFIRGVPEVMIDFFPLSLFNLYYYNERFCCPSHMMFTKPTRTDNKVIHTCDRYTSVRPANLRWRLGE